MDFLFILPTADTIFYPEFIQKENRKEQFVSSWSLLKK
jgi:hypothetical protein